MDARRLTLTQRIAADVRRAITAGAIPPGGLLPSEIEYVEQYGASRGTIRRALQQLVGEGVITVHPGKGYVVRSHDALEWWPGTFEHTSHRRDSAPDASYDAWASDVVGQGRQPQQEVDVALIPAPPVVAERLGLEPEKDLVAVRRRLRRVDAVPWQIADSYYPEDIARDSPIMTPGDLTIPGGLMAHVGHRQTRFVDEITVRMPTVMETSRLELPAATPVAEHLRTGFDEAGRAVRVIITIAPGDRHKIMYEVTSR
jgi:DNA-binding GntR family transcriptional regulator